MAKLIDIDGELLPRWWGIMRVLADMPVGDTEDFEEDIDPKQYANQLRAMLSQNKNTCKFHWSVRRNGSLISVTKDREWEGFGLAVGGAAGGREDG
jgi:hypothetical protein